MTKGTSPSILFIPRFDYSSSCDDESENELSPADETTQPADFTRSDGCRLHYVPSFAVQDKNTAAQTINTLIDKGWCDEKRFYQILPDMSTKDTGWPQSTEVYCWWCSHPFETRPVPIATKYLKSTFTVFGNFCSFNCAKAYLLKSNKNTTNTISLNLFLYKKMTGSLSFRGDSSPIIPAPPREMLKIFGGPFSIEEFRESSLQLKEFKAYPFNCISINDHIEESVRLAIRSAGVSQDGLPPAGTASKAKRKRKNNDDTASKDLDLRARMEEAKVRLDTRPPPTALAEKKTASETAKKPRKKSDKYAVNPIVVAHPVPDPEDSNRKAPDDPGSSEYVLNGMMGLKIIRREKTTRNKK